MILWIILTAIVAVVSVLLAIPFIRRLDETTKDDGQALAIARDQISEIEREQAAGLIGQAEAEQARSEIERRILIAARTPKVAARQDSDTARLIAVGSVVGWVVVGGALLYPVVGRPDLPSVPFTQRSGVSLSQSEQQNGPVSGQSEPAATVAAGNVPGSVEELIVSLAARLEDNPNDAEGWRMLGWSYFNTEDYTQAALAYEKSVALDASDSDVLSAYGETLVRSEDGLVSEKAISVFDDALALNPDDPRARFFKGMAFEQAGDPKAAIKIWQNILDTAPPGAEWTAGLEQRIQELVASSNIDVSDLPGTLLMPPKVEVANPAPNPTAEDVQAAQEMSPEDRQAMIRSMVDSLASRLAEDPNDSDGWARLMRSRVVLGERDLAQSAFDQASEFFHSDAEAMAQLRQAAQDLGLKSN